MSAKKKQTFSKKVEEKFIRYERDILLALIPLIFLVLYGIVSIVADFVGLLTSRQSIVTQSVAQNVTDYTFFSKPIEPPISAQAALIMDSDSKVVMYAKNSTLRFSMASTTKLMTALVALEHFKPNDILTVYTSQVEGVNVGFEVGEQIYFEDALYAMMLPSGNDAALLIAQNYPGGFETFITKMNEKAVALRLVNTHYADPSGLNDDGNYTTVVDLARLFSTVVEHPRLSLVIGTRSRIMSNVAGTKVYNLENLNRLLGYYGVTGGKTGYTEGAGGVLVTSAVSNGHTFIVVVMKSIDRFVDTETLLSYVVSDITYFTPRSNP
jgi:D-alanyl-D-alanine carboxypeptidase